LLDRPISSPHTVDLYYTAFHPRIKSENDIIMIPYGYADSLAEMLRIFFFMESSDFATSRALYEDYDKLIDDIRELLAKNPSAAPYRKVARSW
jgi:hypothetical protein